MKSAAVKRPTKRRLRHWPRAEDDFYSEPPWIFERFFALEPFEGRIWDPAAGRGHAPAAARAAGHQVISSDITNRGFKCARVDFLKCDEQEDNIVGNPPFALADRFVRQALQLARRKVAMILPCDWLCADKRSRWIEGTPLRRIYFITPRPSMPPGHGAANPARDRGLANYILPVWLKGYDGRPEVRWLRRDGAAP